MTARNTGINVYDIRKPCIGSLCYDFSLLTRWINQDYVRRALGARRRRWDGPCSNSAHSALMGDWLYSYDSLLIPMLESGIRVVIYAGTPFFFPEAVTKLLNPHTIMVAAWFLLNTFVVL